MSDSPPRRGQPPKPAERRADAQIQLRVTRRRKAAYVSSAQAGGETLSAWLLRHADAAAREAEREPGD
jgi:uncharacterized protein (DUF1778 family)